MNIHEIRLELVKLAIDKCASPSAIPEIVEPLAQYVLKGADVYSKHADECDKQYVVGELKDFEKKYIADLLKKLQHTFGERKISAIEIEKDGSLLISICDRSVRAGINIFFENSNNYPDFFRGRKLYFLDVPPKRP